MVKQLGAYATPTLFEAGKALGVATLPTAIKPLFMPISLAGPAYPVQARPGDNAAVHFALAAAPKASVLVVAIGGDVEHAFWGEIMMEAALAAGVRGLVTDGAIRDSSALRARGFPVFCAGTAIAGTEKRWRGAQQAAVVLGHATVRAGDYVVGDDDGVVVVPQEHIDAVIRQAQARLEKEEAMIERLRQGDVTVDLLGLRETRGEKEPSWLR